MGGVWAWFDLQASTSSRAMLDKLLLLLGFPLHSGDALLGGFFPSGIASPPMVRFVGLSPGVLVIIRMWSTLGMLQRLRHLASRLEELETARCKELEVVVREYSLPGRLQALGSVRELGAPRVCHQVDNSLLQGLLLRIPVSRRGGIWNQTE